MYTRTLKDLSHSVIEGLFRRHTPDCPSRRYMNGLWGQIALEDAEDAQDVENAEAGGIPDIKIASPQSRL